MGHDECRLVDDGQNNGTWRQRERCSIPLLPLRLGQWRSALHSQVSWVSEDPSSAQATGLLRALTERTQNIQHSAQLRAGTQNIIYYILLLFKFFLLLQHFHIEMFYFLILFGV